MSRPITDSLPVRPTLYYNLLSEIKTTTLTIPSAQIYRPWYAMKINELSLLTS